jgi:PAS domain S-box-containing protein
LQHREEVAVGAAWTKEQLLGLLDTIQEGVFVVDRNSHISFFNRAAEHITGTQRADAKGRPCWEVLRADCCGSDCPLRTTLATGERFSERLVSIVSADGSRKTLSIATTVLRDEDGDIAGAVETFRDISGEDARFDAHLTSLRHHNIVTISPVMQKMLESLPLVADSDSTVLLQGESGTGKELLARAIHALSPRKGRPFVAVNCGALPDNLLESELFGYKAGAFTDAKRDKPGRFALAEGGVVFLDEIGDTSPAMQAKLLRVLQERVYEPLGGTRTVVADVRIVTATNRDLADMMERKEFRQDLYYRLNVISITIPPLRERREDVPLLVDYFIHRLNKLQGKRVRGVDDEAMAYLMAHDYPGNVRELENLVERAFVLCHKGLIQPRHLPEALAGSTALPLHGEAGPKSIKGVEAAFLANALKRNQWDRQRTAAELGMHRSTLFRKIRALGLSEPDMGAEAP